MANGQRNAKSDGASRLDARKQRAAVLLAEDELTNEQIAAEIGVRVETLWRWRQDPDFAAAVGNAVGEMQAAMLRHRVAKKRERMKVLDDLHERQLAVIAHRAERYRAKLGDDPEAAAAEAARSVFGGDALNPRRGTPYEAVTGLLVEKESVNTAGHRTVEWSVDTGLLREIRATHEQAARELGQWVDKSEVETKSTVVRVVGVDAGSI